MPKKVPAVGRTKAEGAADHVSLQEVVSGSCFSCKNYDSEEIWNGVWKAVTSSLTWSVLENCVRCQEANGDPSFFHCLVQDSGYGCGCAFDVSKMPMKTYQRSPVPYSVTYCGSSVASVRLMTAVVDKVAS